MLRLSPLLSTLTIQGKDVTEGLIKFPIDAPFAWAQREFLAEIERQYNGQKPVRAIVLKARQLGISTATEAILFWWSFIHPGAQSLVIAHENKSSAALFAKTKLYWDTWPYKQLYEVKQQTQQKLSWEGILSSMEIASAKNSEGPRGRTLHAVHLSECAFYQNPEAFMLGLNQTVPHKHGTMIVLESTANGVGNWFHEMWLDAERGANEYAPLFFPWWRHPEYRHLTTLCTSLELTADERQLMRLGADYEAIQWRRWAIPNLAGNDEQLFMQEYPATPEEAFITTGTNVFPIRKLDDCYQPSRGYRGMLVGDESAQNPKFVADSTGPLTIFKGPTNKDRRWDRYFVAGDPSMTVAGDPACIQVINRYTMEQVAVWHGRIDPINFAREMMLLGRYYHDAELCPEIEGGGQATVATILNAGYPNIWQHRWADKAPGKVAMSYGWSTNWNRKHWAIGRLRFLLADDSIVIHDKETYSQMRSYITHENGEMGNAQRGIHDDAVMALAIGVTASMMEGPFSARSRNNANVVDLYGYGEDELR